MGSSNALGTTIVASTTSSLQTIIDIMMIMMMWVQLALKMLLNSISSQLSAGTTSALVIDLAHRHTDLSPANVDR